MTKNNDFVRGSGWFALPNFVWDENELSLYEKGVISNLLRRLGGDGSCFPSREKIAKDTGMSVRKTQQVLKSLTKKGLIISERRFRKSSIYRLGPRLTVFNKECTPCTIKNSKVHEVHPNSAPHALRSTTHLSTTHHHHQEATENSPDPERQDTADSVAAELKKLGINGNTIKGLVKNHPAGRIETHIARYRETLKEAEHKGHKKPGPGLLVQAIREDWQDEVPDLDPIDDLPEDIRDTVRSVMNKGDVNLSLAKMLVSKIPADEIMKKIKKGVTGRKLVEAFKA